MASRAPIPGMSSAIPRWPTPTPTCDAIHGMRAAKLPVTHPCTANTAAVPRRACRTSGAGAARPGVDVAAAITVRDYPPPVDTVCTRTAARGQCSGMAPEGLGGRILTRVDDQRDEVREDYRALTARERAILEMLLSVKT